MPRGIYPRRSTEICRVGHDKRITGRLKNNACKLCSKKTQSDYRWRQPIESRRAEGRRYYWKYREKLLARNNRARLARKAWVDEIKLKAGCTDCGYNKNSVALDFDHLRDKMMNVSMMTTRASSRSRILAEIAKCEVVCANCHRIRSLKRKNDSQSA